MTVLTPSSQCSISELHSLPLTKRYRIINCTVAIRPLQDSFRERAKEMLEARAEGEAGARRKRHASLQEQLQGLWVRAKLFEKGAELFDGTTLLSALPLFSRSLG